MNMDLRHFLRWFVPSVLACAFALIFSEGVTTSNLIWGFICYLILTLFLVLLLIWSLFIRKDKALENKTIFETMYGILGLFGKEGQDKLVQDVKELIISDFAIALTGALIFPVLFGQVCRHLYILWGGFKANGADYLNWVGFGFNWLINGLTFDIPQILGLNISQIHADSLWARVVEIPFVVILQLLIISAVFQGIELWLLHRTLRKEYSRS